MNKRERAFVDIVWRQYRENGRHDLPWRQTTDPYKILVSELMLQQTQVARVVGKYEEFVGRWPNAKRLASAPLGEVLRAWQGLGYNRRAKYLHETAQVITKEKAGQFPQDEAQLRELPGLGSYTAAAVCAFAYKQPVVLIETNIRQVFLHHFFTKRTGVADAEIIPFIKKTLPEDNTREWYWALMDYGAYLKTTHGNNLKRSKHYVKQSKFIGSDRQIRGAIIRLLSEQGRATAAELKKLLGEYDGGRVAQQLAHLTKEGLIKKTSRHFELP